MKEVGVRKVMGAGIANIIIHLSRGFLLLLAISIFVAIPVAYFGNNLWLQLLAYRITVSPGIMITGVMILLGIASSLIFVNVGKSMGNRQAKSFAQEIVSLCKKARQMAIDNGVPTSLNVSSTQRRCWVSGATRSLEVPEQMLIEGEGVIQLNEDIYAIRFYPDGSSGGGELTLSISGHIIYAFRVDALTGILTRIEEDA